MSFLERAKQFVKDFPGSSFARLSLFGEEMRSNIEIIESDPPLIKGSSLGWVVHETTGLGIINVPNPYPEYLDPRPAKWSEVSCPVCGEEQCYITSSFQTLLSLREAPKGHEHDPNQVTVHVACLNDHEFTYVRSNPCPACDYGHGAPILTEIEGRRLDRFPRISANETYTLGDKPKMWVSEPKFVGKMPVRQDVKLFPSAEQKKHYTFMRRTHGI